MDHLEAYRLQQQSGGADDISTDRLLREQQDEAYRESLRLDKERALLKQEEEQRRKEEERRKEEARKSRALQLEAKKAERRRLAAAFRKEDEFGSSIAANEQETTQICLKLPSGLRLERRFLQSDLLRRVYDWAAACEVLHEDKLNGASIPQAFRLTTPLSAELSPSKTLAQCGLIPNALMLLLPESDHDDEVAS